jgi:hypothetical protein
MAAAKAEMVVARVRAEMAAVAMGGTVGMAEVKVGIVAAVMTDAAWLH